MMKTTAHNWIIYGAAGLAWLGLGYFALNVPAGLVTILFLPTVTQADLAEDPYMDYSGFNAGDDIPRLEGAWQYDEGVYTTLDFVTVETAAVIPLDYYRLKNPSDVNSRDQYLGRGRAFTGRPLAEYTRRPARRDYLYGRYYILGLSDGSYVAAYGDRSYGVLSKTGRKITFPIGRMRTASSQEQGVLEEAGKDYPVDGERVLYLINDRRIDDLNFIDLIIRFAALAIVTAAAFIILLIIIRIKKKT